MRSKLAGHALQLLGYGLCFLGLGLAATAFLVAGNFPAVPTWVFVVAAVVLGAPLMIAGARIDSRGRGLVLGMSPGQAAREYRETTARMALFLVFLLSLSALATAPVFAWAAGLANPNVAFIMCWMIGWLLVFGAGRAWTTVPLWCAIERRVLGTRDTVTWRTARPTALTPPATYSSSSASPSTSSLT